VNLRPTRSVPRLGGRHGPKEVVLGSTRVFPSPILLVLALLAPGAARATAPARCNGPAGPNAIDVVVTDYVTERPVEGVEIVAAHRMNCSKQATRDGGAQCTPTHPHPEALLSFACRTPRDGRLRFALPDLDYEVEPSTPKLLEGYAQPWEVSHWRRSLDRLEVVSTSGDGKTRTVLLRLVPLSLLRAEANIRTPERAIEVARERIRDCFDPRAQIRGTAKNYWGEWQVKLGVATLTVEAIGGAARVDRCEAACCRDPKDRPSAAPLYAPAEAIADALSGPLEHVGTGPWHGIFQIQSCAYRNDRVLVVDVYCTRKEIHSAGLVVFHPRRGRATFYAEARAPISTIDRSRYLQWKIEVEDPPTEQQLSPGVRTDMTFAELTGYDAARYSLSLPSCFGALKRSSGKALVVDPGGGCRRKTPEVERAWAEALRALLAEPPAGWAPLLKELRRLAREHGRRDPRTR